MGTADLVVFGAYLGGILLLGAAFYGRRTTGSEYFLAGRSMGWFPVGLSVMATMFSAVNFTAFPLEVFGHGLYVIAALPAFALVAWPVTRIFIPFYHRMRLCSIYEYLELRFDVRVRCLASGMFILWRVFWMAAAIYASSRVLGAMTGISPGWIMLISGAAATAYTAAGGMRAVMWTDVAQFFVFLGAIVAALVLAMASNPEGATGVFRVAAEGGILRPFYPFDPDFLSWDPRVRITVWSALIGAFTAFLARYGVDQLAAQRYLAARSLEDAQKGFRLNYLGAIFSIGLLALFGIALHAYAVGQGFHPGDPGSPMIWLARFARSLPAGTGGLLAAGLLAAAMSSVDSGIHSCSLVLMRDFWGRLLQKEEAGGEEAADLRPSRGVTLAMGVLAVGMAFAVGRLGTIFEIAAKVVNGFGSPLLAVFLLGMFSRRMSSQGVLLGGLAGVGWSVYVSFAVKGLALHYYAVLNFLGTLLLCAIFHRLARAFGAPPSPEQSRWTWPGPGEPTRSDA